MITGVNSGDECVTGGAAARSACAEGQSADGASAASALGSTQSYCFTPLSTNEGQTVADLSERRRIRWGARAMLWQASSLKAVRCCGRVLHNDSVGDPDDGQGVLIRRREVDGRMVASYHGAMTCGSVWACPRCSAVIAHTRATEIASAVRECSRRGGRVYLMTLTMRHSSRDGLSDLWDGLTSGWRSAFGTRAWTGQRARTVTRKGCSAEVAEYLGDAALFGVAGLTRVVEATYGAPADGGNGWHLHIHALVFVEASLTLPLSDFQVVEPLEDAVSSRRSKSMRTGSRVLGNVREFVEAGWSGHVDSEWLARNIFASRVHERWSRGLEKAGCAVPGSVGVDVRLISDVGSEYLGQYLAKATYDVAGRVGSEIGAGQLTKTARTGRNRTPFEILAALSESVDARGFGVRTPRHWSVVPAEDGDWAILDSDTGEVVSVTPPGEWRIWHEWEQSSKGRRQIMWSRRRRDPSTSRELLWNSLLDARGVSAEHSDEDVAVVEVEGEVVAEISREEWYRLIVWSPSLMVELLEAAEERGASGVLMRLMSARSGNAKWDDLELDELRTE